MITAVFREKKEVLSCRLPKQKPKCLLLTSSMTASLIIQKYHVLFISYIRKKKKGCTNDDLMMQLQRGLQGKGHLKSLDSQDHNYRPDF